MKILKNYFLPLGLLLAIVLGLLEPQPGIALAEFHKMGPFSSSWLIALVFLISGFQFKLKELSQSPTLTSSVAAAIAINLVGAPLLGWLISRWLGPPFALGVWTMMIVPTTLSSAMVISRQAGGNVSLAVMLTLILSCVGVLSMSILNLPFQPQLILPRFIKLSEIVLVPLSVGILLQKVNSRKDIQVLKLISSLCIIAMVWLSVSKTMAQVQGIGLKFISQAVLLSLSLHLVLYILAHVAGKGLLLNRENLITLRFISSQKTLPLALLLILASPQQDTQTQGFAIAFCLIFHFVQIFSDSLMASSFISKSTKA